MGVEGLHLLNLEMEGSFTINLVAFLVLCILCIATFIIVPLKNFTDSQTPLSCNE